VTEDDLPFGEIHGIRCGPFLGWIRGRNCVVPDCKNPGEVHHVRGRRYGDIAQSIQLCHPCHMEIHAKGKRSFEQTHGINLMLEAARAWVKWLEREEERLELVDT